MERRPASERTREKLKALMEGRSEAEDGRSELVRLAGRWRAKPGTLLVARTTPGAGGPAPAIATATGLVG